MAIALPDNLWPTAIQSSVKILILGLLLCLGYALYTITYNLLFHPLRKYPGPKLWAVSEIPYVLMYISGTPHLKLRDLHCRYGEIIRIGPNHLSFQNPRAWKELLGHRKSGEPESGDRENHTWQRRMLAHGFSTQALHAQEGLIKQYVDLLVLRLRERGNSGRTPQDMVRWFNFITFDIIGDLAFGEPFGSLEKGSYNPWVETIFDLFKLSAYSWAFSRILLLRKLKHLMISKDLLRKLMANNSLVEHTLKKRLEKDMDRPDFIHYMTRRQGGANLSLEEVEANARLFVGAGSETTASALSALIFYLGSNAPVKEKVTNEVRASFNSEDEISISSVQRLPYLNAVIEEGLRLFPPTPLGTPRITPPEGVMAFGNHIPGGTVLDIWQWPMFRNPKYFRQADEFIPERWMGDSRFIDDSLDMVQPFSFGPRNCLGKNLAWAEMRLIFARLLWNFDFVLAEDSYSWMANMKVYNIYDKPKLNVFCIPRKFE